MSTHSRDPRPFAVTPPTAQDAWAVELDRLELEVLWAERLLKASRPLDSNGWEPPTEMPPLLPEHEARARTLLARQEQVRLQLMTAMREIVRSQSCGSSYGDATAGGHAEPRYIDLVG